MRLKSVVDSAHRRDECATKLLAWLIGAALMMLAPGVSALAAGKPLLPLQVSTSPSSNLELNPYGLAIVPAGFPSGGLIKSGDLLVSNFNNAANQQGEGTTIIFVDPTTGNSGLFFQGQPLSTPIGFTNALAVARKGFIFAGSVTTTDGTSGTAAPGPLLVIDKSGTQVTTINQMLDGPWGLAINDKGKSAQLFVSNVFNGTVTRLDVTFSKTSVTVGTAVTIASGYGFKTDPAAIVVGPAGLAYNQKRDILYVADEDDDEIFAISDASKITSSAGTGTSIFSNSGSFQSLNGPLGLVIAPNGDLITVNADSVNQVNPPVPSDVIEFTPGGTLVRESSIDPNLGAGFAIVAQGNLFAYVDDVVSNLTVWNLSKK